MSEEPAAEATSRADHEEGFWNAYRREVKAVSAFKKLTELDENRIMAKHLVREERGEYGPYGVDYRLNGETIGLLLAHAREDAALAVLNTTTLWKEVQSLKRGLFWLSILSVAIFALLVRSVVVK